MDPSMLSSLAQLIAPLSVEEFFEDYWLSKPATIHGPPQRLPPWLSRSPLDDFHALAASYRGNLSIQSGRYSTKQVPLNNTHAADLYEMGLSIYFHDIADYVSDARDYLHTLATELGLEANQVKAAAFASPPGDGLAFHYDTYEIFSIQLCGTKTFKLAPVEEVEFPCGQPYAIDTKPADEVYPQMNNGFPQRAPQYFDTVHLEPGSVLYMPRGTWHSTQASEDSLSVSIAMVAPPVVDVVLEQLRTYLLQDPSWRRPLYGFDRHSTLNSTAVNKVNELIGTLPDQLKSLGPIIPPPRQPADDQQHSILNRHTRFQRNPVCCLDTEQRSADTAMVALKSFERGYGQPYGADTEFELPASLLPVVEWVDSRNRPFSVNELASAFPQVPFEHLCALLHALCEGELLKQLWFSPLASGKQDNRNISWSTRYTQDTPYW